MTLARLARLAVVLAPMLGLAGCVSIYEDLIVTSETTAAGRLTMEVGPFATALLKSGDGGSFWDRMGSVSVWNTVMDEDRYMVRKWNEFVAA